MSDYRVCVGMFGVQDLWGGDARSIVEVAKMADDAGIAQLSFTDHVIMSRNVDVYPFGDFPVSPEYPWFEPMVSMSVVAGATQRVRFASSVLIAPLRPAALLAKMAATLDVLSNGRLDLGIGVGWQKEEYLACGVDFSQRMQLMDDQVNAMRSLWSDAPVSVASQSVNFDNLYSTPRPLQEGGVPLWYGLKPNEENIARIAKTGVGWLPIQSRVSFIEPAVKALRAAFRKEGRNPDELMVRAVAPIGLGRSGRPSLNQSLERVAPLVEAGVTHVEFMPSMYVKRKKDFPSFFKKLSRLGKL